MEQLTTSPSTPVISQANTTASNQSEEPTTHLHVPLPKNRPPCEQSVLESAGYRNPYGALVEAAHVALNALREYGTSNDEYYAVHKLQAALHETRKHETALVEAFDSISGGASIGEMYVTVFERLPADDGEGGGEGAGDGGVFEAIRLRRDGGEIETTGLEIGTEAAR